MKQGGDSWNNSVKSKKGITSRFKCNICGRQYKQEWSRNSHHRGCKEFNKK